MDRNKLVDLFQKGMQYPPGKHRFWISRCFEITVRPDSAVELDEYEGFSTEEDLGEKSVRARKPRGGGEMFHVGRSVLNLKDGGVVEEKGIGWEKELAKKA